MRIFIKKLPINFFKKSVFIGDILGKTTDKITYSLTYLISIYFVVSILYIK